MPTSTFYHLPEAKRKKLTDAIRQELLRVPYEEISINQIIQKAEIPRGSFYQYFSDKDDMIRMILGDMMQKMEEIVKDSLIRHNGNPFALVQDIFALLCRVSSQTDLCLLYRNLLSGMKIREDGAARFPLLPCQEKLDRLITHLDLSLWDLRKKEDAFDCADILISLLKSSVVELFAEPERKTEIAESFQNKIAILRRGMDPKQEESAC